MNDRVPSLKVIIFLMLALFASNACFAGSEDSSKPACTAPEFRQFDFWVGNWDVFEIDGVTKAALVRVDRILDGCVLHELYEDPNGLKGQSFTIYDAGRKLWHQSWVTNRGQLLVIEGTMQTGGEIVLTGAYRNESGAETRVRGTWKTVDGGVRETAVKSIDGGKSWKPWFDLLFRPRASASTTTEDAKVVAALDTQYQAAVKANDAATMDHILADDFILVTGSGKVFSKPDLLEEARTRQTSYEHQEDAEQKVRIWGATAVVTARLWEKGSRSGKPFDYALWFSDTYVRTPAGWRYVFGQASLPLANR